MREKGSTRTSQPDIPGIEVFPKHTTCLRKLFMAPFFSFSKESLANKQLKTPGLGPLIALKVINLIFIISLAPSSTTNTLLVLGVTHNYFYVQKVISHNHKGNTSFFVSHHPLTPDWDYFVSYALQAAQLLVWPGTPWS